MQRGRSFPAVPYSDVLAAGEERPPSAVLFLAASPLVFSQGALQPVLAAPRLFPWPPPFLIYECEEFFDLDA
jgi:hypothetical protein